MGAEADRRNLQGGDFIMLTNKQKKTLRAMAQSQRAIMQVGKDGLGSNSVKTLADAFEAHELVKITLLKTCPIDVNEAAA